MSFDINKIWAERPLGMRDVYSTNARLRRWVESQSLDFFEQSQFQCVSSGVFEYVETLLRGRRSEDAENWVKLFDSSGKAIALRPEMTPAIARMAAPLLIANGMPIRWCYAERVYRRVSDPSTLSWAGGEAVESTQVGIEWIGESGPKVDSAVLLMCLAAARNLGLNDCQLVLSHAAFTQALLRTLDVSEAAIHPLLHVLATGDYVGFAEGVRTNLVPFDVLRILRSLNPYVESSLNAIPESSNWRTHPMASNVLDAWSELVTLANQLKTQGKIEGITFDLTLQRDFTYYTGVVFEVFTPLAGSPIALGGRYDDLLAQFGAPSPAIGFVLHVERICEVLKQVESPDAKEIGGMISCPCPQ